MSIRSKTHSLAWVMLIGALLWACSRAAPPPAMSREVRESNYYAHKAVRFFTRGCYDRALDYFQDAHERYTAADHLEGVAHSLNGIADIFYRQGQLESAVLVYDDAIDTYQTVGDLPGAIQSMCNKAAALTALGRLEAAADVLQKAKTLDRDGSHAALRLRTRALLAIKQEDLQNAQALLDDALSAAEAQKTALSGIYFTRGHVALLNDQPSRAKDAFEQALLLDRESGAYHDIARDLQGLGNCYTQMGDHQQALQHFKRSAKIYALLQDTTHAAGVTDALKKSAILAGANVQATLLWVQQWMEEGFCD